jgi:hypothetical protein
MKRIRRHLPPLALPLTGCCKLLNVGEGLTDSSRDSLVRESERAHTAWGVGERRRLSSQRRRLLSPHVSLATFLAALVGLTSA